MFCWFLDNGETIDRVMCVKEKKLEIQNGLERALNTIVVTMQGMGYVPSA